MCRYFVECRFVNKIDDNSRLKKQYTFNVFVIYNLNLFGGDTDLQHHLNL